MRLLAAIALVLGACSIFPKDQTVNDRFYVLTADQATGDPSSAQPAPPTRAPVTSVVVARVTLPGYLDRAELVTRRDEHQLSMRRDERWAETLVDAVPRVFTADLAAALRPAGVTVRSGAVVVAVADVIVAVEITRFERNTNGAVELRATWTLQDPKGQLRSGQTEVTEKAEVIARPDDPTTVPGEPDGEAAAAALSRALHRMAEEVADSVLKTKR
jgi:uncharacterized lipoprotein YmbA